MVFFLFCLTVNFSLFLIYQFLKSIPVQDWSFLIFLFLQSEVSVSYNEILIKKSGDWLIDTFIFDSWEIDRPWKYLSDLIFKQHSDLPYPIPHSHYAGQKRCYLPSLKKRRRKISHFCEFISVTLPSICSVTKFILDCLYQK